MDVNTTYLRRFPPRLARDIPGRVSRTRWRYSRVNIARCSYVLRVREARVGAPSTVFVSRFYFGRSIVKVMGHRKDGSPIYLRARIFTYIPDKYASVIHFALFIFFVFYLWYFFSFFIINYKRSKMIPSLSHKYSIFESATMKVSEIDIAKYFSSTPFTKF